MSSKMYPLFKVFFLKTLVIIKYKSFVKYYDFIKKKSLKNVMKMFLSVEFLIP